MFKMNTIKVVKEPHIYKMYKIQNKIQHIYKSTNIACYFSRELTVQNT